jgi:hypothetical protein
MPDTTPHPRGTSVRYHGAIPGHYGDLLTVLGTCVDGDGRQPRYLLADPWDDPHADVLTLPPTLTHIPHADISYYPLTLPGI